MSEMIWKRPTVNLFVLMRWSPALDCMNVLSHAHILQTQKGLVGRPLGSRQGFLFTNCFLKVDAASSNNGRLTH